MTHRPHLLLGFDPDQFLSHRSDTGTSTRLTTTAGRSIYPQTDGVRAAWQQLPPGGAAGDPFTLVSQPLAGGATTTWSSTATSFFLRNGLLY